MQGAPIVSDVIGHDGAIIWPTQSVRSRVFAEQRALAFTELPHFGLLVWLHKDLLLKKLDALVSEEQDDASALSAEARALAAATAQADLLAAEREESHFVAVAQAAGLPAEHRPDANPVGLLNLVLVTRATTAALPPTSPAIDYIGPR